MTSPRILLLEASGHESHAIAATAVARGYDVFAVTQPDRWDRYDDGLRRMLAGCFLTDLAAPDLAASAIAAFGSSIRVDAVLTTNEYLTSANAKVCAELGLPGNVPALAGAARNKAAMWSMLLKCGVPSPRTIVVESAAGFEQILDDSGIEYPLVIKPAEAAGSGGVTIVNGRSALTPAIAAAYGQRSMYGAALDRRLIVQEHLAGTEFSVESVTQDGITHHLCLTRKLVSGGATRVELGHSVPADAGPHTGAILELARQAIAAVGIRNSFSHTEVMLMPDGGCVVIEVAARIAAGYIGHLIVEALGIDPWAACLDLALGNAVQFRPTKSRHAAVRFLTADRAGTLASVAGLPGTDRETPIVQMRAAIGSQVGPAASNADRLGCIVIVGDDAASVNQRADDLLRTITIEVADPR